jgi:hypothetical protein
MPALVAGIHVLIAARKQDVDGRDKPGHDGLEATNSAATSLHHPLPLLTQPINSDAVRYGNAAISKRREGKGAPRRAHQSVSETSDVPLSAAQDRRRSVFLHACARRPRRRSVRPCTHKFGSMSASLRKRTTCCAAAKGRYGPIAVHSRFLRDVGLSSQFRTYHSCRSG